MIQTIESPNVAAAMSFIRAVEEMDGREMEEHFAPDVQQVEMPNIYKPSGAVRDLTALKSDIEKAKGIIEQQRYEIVSTVASGDMVVFEMIWHGVVASDLPSLAKGTRMRAQCVAIFQFEDGKVVRLRNYDCFDPIQAA
ncbi:nuclear transport factor 2 family protein [Mameliella sp.]|uniref:nuclear transport factor 2 family protein n=1 Tax=Mameliella sp. TaxID=1924940 RepID=UPI003B50021C